MEISRKIKRAALLAVACASLAGRAEAQSIGAACPTAGRINIQPNEILYCNSSNLWSIGEEITSGGLVGIGTATPGEVLSVDGNIQVISPLAGSFGSNDSSWDFANTTDTSNSATDALYIYPRDNSAHRIFLGKSGNTAYSLDLTNTTHGIVDAVSVSGVSGGTIWYFNGSDATYGDNSLDIQPNIDTYHPVIIRNTRVVDSASSVGMVLKTQNALSSAGSILLNVDNGSTHAFTITGGGNVGIGTASPSQTLEVNGTAKIDTGLIAPLIYPPSDSTTAIQIDKANGTSNVIDIDTTNGRVGIGTTSPATGVNIVGTVPSNGTFTAQTYTSTGVNGGTTEPATFTFNHTDSPAASDVLYGLYADATPNANVSRRVAVYGQSAGHQNDSAAYQSLSAGVEGYGSRSTPGVLGVVISSNGAGDRTAGVEGVTTESGSGVIGVNTYGTDSFPSAGVYALSTGLNPAFYVKQTTNPYNSSAAIMSGLATGVTSHQYMRLQQTTSAFTGNGIYLDFANGSGSFTGDYLYFTNNTTAKFAVNSSGSVGIGNGSPGVLLDVGLAGTTEGTMRLESSTASSYVQLQASTTSGSWTMTLPAAAPSSSGYVLSSDTSGNTSWVAPGGTVTLGTSASVTNPQRTGDATTGMFSATVSTVSVSAAGTDVGDFAAAGLNLPGTATSYKLNGINAIWQDNTNFNIAVGDTAFPTTISQAGGGSNGTLNTALGYRALNANTTGAANTAVGELALSVNTTGINNSAVGVWALKLNTTGTWNAAMGANALASNTGGTYNTAIGGYALSSNTTGAANTAVGYVALDSNSTSSGNTALGSYALQFSNGNYNTALGSGVLYTVTTGTNNTAIGYDVGSTTLTTGSNNILIGTSAAVTTTATGTNYNLNIGNLLQGDMTNSTALGKEALYLQSTASSVDYLQIAGGVTGNPGNGTLSAQGTDSNVNIILQPKGTGNVGIGTASPGNLLEVDNNNTNSAIYANNAGYGNGVFGNSVNGIGVNAAANGTNAAVVGVNYGGSSGPGVVGSSTSGASGLFQSAGAANTAPTLVTERYSTSTADLFQAQNASGVSLVKITDTGNVGIGTTGPQATLDVNGYARLKLNSSQPVVCSSTNQGAIALNHLAQMCACNGSSWIFADSTGAACSW